MRPARSDALDRDFMFHPSIYPSIYPPTHPTHPPLLRAMRTVRKLRGSSSSSPSRPGTFSETWHRRVCSEMCASSRPARRIRCVRARTLPPSARVPSHPPHAVLPHACPRRTQAFGALEKVPSGRGSVDMLVAGDPPERARAHARTGAHARTSLRARRDVVRGLLFVEEREEELA